MSLGFKVSNSEKQFINDVLNKIKEDTGKTKSDCLIYLVNEYVSLSSGGEITKDMPTSIRQVLTEVKKECPYLRHRDFGFVCLENVNTKKKEEKLSIVPKETIEMCRMCIRKKKELRQKEIDKLRQKESIKKLLDFAKQFRTVIGKGVLKDLYFCFHDVYSDDSQIIFSTNGKTLKCPIKFISINY